MWGMIGLMSFGMIFWIAILVLVVYLILQPFRRQAIHSGQSDALRILQKRYARGEIDRDAYNRMKDDLGRH